jgi:hypothetical protein
MVRKKKGEKGLKQFTPDQAPWDELNPKKTNHWPGRTIKAKWPAGLSKQEKRDRPQYDFANEAIVPDHAMAFQYACSSDFLVRGMKERVNRKSKKLESPFKDKENPTRTEMDKYNQQILNQIRENLGIPQPGIRSDNCLFARALWSDEYMFDPSTNCNGNSHCGAPLDISKPGNWREYVPEWQAANNNYCLHNTIKGAAEGIAGTNMNTIWPERLQKVMCQFIAQDGLVAHGGPIRGRQLFGVSFWLTDSSGNIQVRLKWGG